VHRFHWAFTSQHDGRASAPVMIVGSDSQGVLTTMLRIDTIETSSAITLELHGRLIGPWVPLLEASWRGVEGSLAGRTLAVDLAGVTAIDGAARYLLRLMEAKNVTLSSGGIGFRALLGDEGGKQNEIR
jgi:hypothetical protein